MIRVLKNIGADSSSSSSSGDNESISPSLVSSLSGNNNHNADVNYAAAKTKSNLSIPDKIYGRRNECNVLRNVFDRVRRNPSSEVVLVCGESGAGKTSIVESVRNDAIANHKAFFASGKFDQMRGNEPYPAIVEAFADVVDLIIQEGTETTRQMVASIREELEDNEVKHLTALVSSLTFLDPMFQTTIGAEDTPDVLPFSRLKNLFRAFLRAVSTPQHPIILFLDDLQWADSASLELIHALTTDPHSKHVLIMLAYRESETKDETLAMICSGAAPSDDNAPAFHLPSTMLRVDQLDLNSINEMVLECLELLDAPVTAMSLSKIILRKTLGNPYHITQYLESLEASGMLKISPNTGRWEWDMTKIELETHVSDNVVQLLAEKIKRLTGTEQAVLKIAACFGHSFHIRVLELVITQEMKVSSNLRARLAEDECLASSLPLEADSLKSKQQTNHSFRNRLTEILDAVSDVGLLETTNTATQLKFSHDRVQQYLYSLSSSREKLAVHARIGRVVWDLAGKVPKKHTREALKFFAVDQLNRGSGSIQDDEEERVRLARMNFDVGKLAASKAAYASATAYLRHGISQLPEETRWTQHYDLARDLLSTSAEAEYSCGHIDQCTTRVNEVLENARCLEDKLRVYATRIDSIGTKQHNFSEAIRVGVGVLRQLGKRVPTEPTKLHVLSKYLGVKGTLRGMSDDDILNRPKMTDPNKMQIVKILSDLAAYARLDGDQTRFGLFSLEMMELSLKLGLSEFSPPAFATYAMFMQVFGKVDEAYRFAMVSLRLLQKLEAKHSVAMTLGMLHHFVFHHRHPIMESIDAFQRAYNAGTACGDINASSFCAYGIVASSVSAGMPLVEVERNCRSYCTQMMESNQEYALRASSPCWQFVLNLMGKSDDSFKLSGEALDEDAILAEAYRTNSVIVPRIVYAFKVQLLYLLGADGELLGETAERSEKHADDLHFNAITGQFFAGLSFYRLARTLPKKKRKYQSLARKKTKKFEQRMKAGNESCRFMLALLQAEGKVMVEGSKNVVEIYDEAVVAARSAGIVQHEALVHERAADAMLGDDDLRDRGISHLEQAICLFEEWGAMEKVSSLEEKYGRFLWGKRDEKREHAGLDDIELESGATSETRSGV